MGAKDLPGELAVRRIWEGATATVVGGLILWSVTGSMSQSTPATERLAVAVAPAIQPTTPSSPSRTTSTASEAPESRMDLRLSIPGPRVATPPPKRNLLPHSVPVGSILLYEDFSHYLEGDKTGWGPNTFIKTGLDRRKWLVSNVDGTHPVGCRIRLPNTFYFQCRYSAYLPEVTRGFLGWWKEPVSTKISFLNDRGISYGIDWVIKCGNDTTRLNPLGSSSLYAKKYYHTISLPDGTANEVEVIQPTGVLWISRDDNVVNVLIDGHAAAVGTTSQMGQLVGFEIDVVNAKNGSLFFTDFKIAR
jgi:hypothetical protein